MSHRPNLCQRHTFRLPATFVSFTKRFRVFSRSDLPLSLTAVQDDYAHVVPLRTCRGSQYDQFLPQYEHLALILSVHPPKRQKLGVLVREALCLLAARELGGL